MFKNLWAKLYWFCLIACLGISHSAFAILSLDVDEFHFSKQEPSQKGVRVIRFDTEKQKFDKIDYFIIPQSKTRFKHTSFHYPDIGGLTISTDGDITVTAEFDLTHYMVRTKGNIIGNGKDHVWYDPEHHAVLQQQDVPVLSGDAVMGALEKYAKQGKMAQDFQISYLSIDFQGNIHTKHTVTFKSISPNRKENSDERGRVGEVATLLTMINFGYRPLMSKYEVNHGNDGIFKARNDTVLFLTESKCRNERKSAQKYLEEDLSEKEIYRKLNRMKEKKDDNLQKSVQEIDLFIKNNPELIFKLAHRVKPDGTCQCVVQPFAITEYNRYAPPEKKEEDENEDIRLMSEVCEKINKPLKEKLLIFMKANQITLTDLQQIIGSLEGPSVHSKPPTKSLSLQRN